MFFHYNKSRGGAVASDLLAGFTGRCYQCDGYAGQKMAVGDKDVTVTGFMDHARRKFVKAEKSLTKKARAGKPVKCTVARSKFDALYRLEREMADLGADEAQRYTMRQEKAIPMLKKLHAWLIVNESKIAKDSLTHKAIKYALNQCENLIAYYDYGQLHICMH